MPRIAALGVHSSNSPHCPLPSALPLATAFPYNVEGSVGQLRLRATHVVSQFLTSWGSAGQSAVLHLDLKQPSGREALNQRQSQRFAHGRHLRSLGRANLPVLQHTCMAMAGNAPGETSHFDVLAAERRHPNAGLFTIRTACAPGFRTMVSHRSRTLARIQMV